MSFRLVDEDGIAFEPEPRAGRYGVDLDGWAEIEGVPVHVWWNLRHRAEDDDAGQKVPRSPSSGAPERALWRYLCHGSGLWGSR